MGGPRVLRSTNGGELIELSLVMAVATVLVIRLVLQLSGYPQLGGNGLHIGHVLYGGLIMFLSLLLLFTVMNPAAPWLAAFAGGVGFGFFIDEVGKFISSDVDYFFEPAVAVIYVVFMVLFIGLARVRRWESAMTPSDALANALSLLRADASGGMDAETRDRVGALLDRTDPSNPLAAVLRDSVEQPARGRPPAPLALRRRARAPGRRVPARRARRHFETVVVIVAVAYFLTKLPLTIRVQVNDTGLDRDADNADFAHLAAAAGRDRQLGLRRHRAVAAEALAPPGLPLVPAGRADLDPGVRGLRLLLRPVRRPLEPGGRPAPVRRAQLHDRPGAGRGGRRRPGRAAGRGDAGGLGSTRCREDAGSASARRGPRAGQARARGRRCGRGGTPGRC